MAHLHPMGFVKNSLSMCMCCLIIHMLGPLAMCYCLCCASEKEGKDSDVMVVQEHVWLLGGMEGSWSWSMSPDSEHSSVYRLVYRLVLTDTSNKKN